MRYIQFGGSVGSTVVDNDVVGVLVVVTGFASEGEKTQSSNSLNSTKSIATKP